MTSRSLVPAALLLSLFGLSACAVPSPEQRRILDSMIGRSETDLVRSYGVPSRMFATGGHTFLAYVQNETSYSPGSPGLGGWGWGGGWGGGGFGGFGGGFGNGFGGGWGGGGFGGWGGGFPASYYQSTCATTFEINNGRVAAWTLRGDGC